MALASSSRYTDRPCSSGSDRTLRSFSVDQIRALSPMPLLHQANKLKKLKDEIMHNMRPLAISFNLASDRPLLSARYDSSKDRYSSNKNKSLLAAPIELIPSPRLSEELINANKLRQNRLPMVPERSLPELPARSKPSSTLLSKPSEIRIMRNVTSILPPKPPPTSSLPPLPQVVATPKQKIPVPSYSPFKNFPETPETTTNSNFELSPLQNKTPYDSANGLNKVKEVSPFARLMQDRPSLKNVVQITPTPAPKNKLKRMNSQERKIRRSVIKQQMLLQEQIDLLNESTDTIIIRRDRVSKQSRLDSGRSKTPELIQSDSFASEASDLDCKEMDDRSAKTISHISFDLGSIQSGGNLNKLLPPMFPEPSSGLGLEDYF